MQRFYAITEPMQVVSDSTSKFANFFSKKNKTSISSQEAIDFFYSTNDRVELYETFEAARQESVRRAGHQGMGYGSEVYPNRHLLYATPIFTVELPDNFPISKRSAYKEIKFSDDVEKKAAAANWMSSHTSHEVKIFYCEKKDITKIIAVDMPHPNFKHQHHEIAKASAVSKP